MEPDFPRASVEHDFRFSKEHVSRCAWNPIFAPSGVEHVWRPSSVEPVLRVCGTRLPAVWNPFAGCVEPVCRLPSVEPVSISHTWNMLFAKCGTRFQVAWNTIKDIPKLCHLTLTFMELNRDICSMTATHPRFLCPSFLSAKRKGRSKRSLYCT